jgi:hypothetical protein
MSVQKEAKPEGYRVREKVIKFATIGVLASGIMGVAKCKDCEDTGRTFTTSSTTSTLSSKDERAVKAKYSPDKATRITAIRALEDNNDALVDIASYADFRDSRLAAVSLIKDADTLMIVVRIASCRDSRNAAVKRLAEITSPDDSIDKNNLEPYIERLAIISALSDNSTLKQMARMMFKAIEDDYTDAESIYKAYMAVYSPSAQLRSKIISELKRKGQAKALGIIVRRFDTEYPATQRAALAALEKVGPLEIPEHGMISDGKRFSECKNEGQTDRQEGSGGRKPRFRDKLRRAWRALTR